MFTLSSALWCWLHHWQSLRQPCLHFKWILKLLKSKKYGNVNGLLSFLLSFRIFSSVSSVLFQSKENEKVLFGVNPKPFIKVDQKYLLIGHFITGLLLAMFTAALPLVWGYQMTQTRWWTQWHRYWAEKTIFWWESCVLHYISIQNNKLGESQRNVISKMYPPYVTLSTLYVIPECVELRWGRWPGLSSESLPIRRKPLTFMKVFIQFIAHPFRQHLHVE